MTSGGPAQRVKCRQKIYRVVLFYFSQPNKTKEGIVDVVERTLFSIIECCGKKREMKTRLPGGRSHQKKGKRNEKKRWKKEKNLVISNACCVFYDFFMEIIYSLWPFYIVYTYIYVCVLACIGVGSGDRHVVRTFGLLFKFTALQSAAERWGGRICTPPTLVVSRLESSIRCCTASESHTFPDWTTPNEKLPI